MYEQYTDKQIVEMLVPKLKKSVPELDWDEYLKRPDDFSIWNRLISVIYKSGYVRGQLGRSFIIGEEKVKESVSPFKAGDKVKFIGFSFENDSFKSLIGSQLYPPMNTIGEVVGVLSSEFCFVQWPKGAVYSNGALSCPNRFLEKVIDEKVTEHWVPATRDNVKVGSKVRMIDEETHLVDHECNPVAGTVGVVEEVCIRTCLAKWPKGTTSDDDKWYCAYKKLEVLLCE